MECPTLTTTYTLTIAAPEDDDWLMAPPITPPTSPSQPQTPPDNDIGHRTVTIGGPTSTPWDCLKSPSPPPVKKRKVGSGRKPLVKNTDSSIKITNLVSLLHPSSSSVGGGVGLGGAVSTRGGVALEGVTSSSSPHKNDKVVPDNHKPVAIQVLNDVQTISTTKSSTLLSQDRMRTKLAHTQTQPKASLSNEDSLRDSTGGVSVATSNSDGSTQLSVSRGSDYPLPTARSSTVVGVSCDVPVTAAMDTSDAVVGGGVINTETNADSAGVNVSVSADKASSGGLKSSAKVSSAEDDILTNALSATLFASESAGSANIITALTSTDFPNLVWTNSDLDEGGASTEGVREAGRGGGASVGAGRPVSVGVVGEPVHLSTLGMAMDDCATHIRLVKTSDSDDSGVTMANSVAITMTSASGSNDIMTSASGSNDITTASTSSSDDTISSVTMASTGNSGVAVITSERALTDVTTAHATPLMSVPSSMMLSALPSTDLTSLVTSSEPLLSTPANKTVTMPTPLLTTPLSSAKPGRPESPVITLVSINSQLFLCNMSPDASSASLQPLPVPSPHDLSPHDPSPHDYFPKPSAVKSFKIPKKPSILSNKQTNRQPSLSHQSHAHSHQNLHTATKKAPHPPRATRTHTTATKVPRPQNVPVARMSSEEAVANSICLKRKRHSLPTVPHTLSYTISSASGRKWTSHDLKGELAEKNVCVHERGCGKAPA